MKLRTRLLITFLAIIILPLFLTSIAFMTIGTFLLKESQIDHTMKDIDYSQLSESIESFTTLSEEICVEIQKILNTNPQSFEDFSFLNRFNEEIRGRNAYLMIRKDHDIFYSGNDNAVEKLASRLPEYGDESIGEKTGYYYSDIQKFVKQIDFIFSDGSEGSIFIVIKMNSLISKSLLIDMFIAIVIILIFTSLMLTRWIHKGVFLPIKDLNIAMKQIAEGNLEYALVSETKGELGDLYKNYEEMRLRLKESTDEKFENEKQNRELISNISHDLKTPITAIKGYVEGLVDGVADTPEKVDRYVKTIYNKAMDMDRLINELTIYSKIDSNRIPYNFHKLNVSEYFGDCVEEVGLDLEAKDIALNYSNLVDPDTLIIADPEQMKRVINNIIGNCVKYIDKKKGIIDIRILDEVDSIRIEIEDNGKGIAQKDLSKIFERFFRTDASRNSSQGGSGIGLSIVKKIVEDHGGYIWATSREREGTCLHFVIRKYKELEKDET